MVALLCLPPNEEPLLLKLSARLRDRWRTQSRPRRELLMFAAALALGLLLLPWLIWIAGHAFLGPYTGGSAWRFIADFLAGLGQGSVVFWAVALGPVGFMLLIRLLLSVANKSRS